MKRPSRQNLRELPSRRDVLKWAAAGAAFAVVPGCRDEAQPKTPPAAPARYRYLTADEVGALEAMADVAFPPDDGLPGGSALGVALFTDRLLTALEPPDGATPTALVSGPYSNRNPIPHADGTYGAALPENDFARWLELDRVATYSWRLYLYGSDAVGGAPNDALTGKVVGLRDRVRTGLQSANAQARVALAQADVAERARVFKALDPEFQALVIQLTWEAVFAVPEYGGNFNRGGWSLAHFEGDSQPLGYSLWDETTQSLRERPDHPLSTANPGPDPEPMDDKTRELIQTLIGALGGRSFE